MDAKVDDFLNEINEIAPPKQSSTDENVWKECQDELTGFSYYWNTKTDEVTWTQPPEFKSQKKPNVPIYKTSNVALPPRTIKEVPPLVSPPQTTKIYSVKEDSRTVLKTNVEKKPQKRSYKQNSDSEDEKIVLISSYGGDSDSEDEEEEEKKELKADVEPTPKKMKGDRIRNDSYQSEEEDDLDILQRIQKRAQELKELGGELPPEVAKITNIPESSPPKNKEKKNIAGFSLVAGYSDSEEEESSEIKTIFAPKPEPVPPPKVSHSTLFPITQPVDVKDFQPVIEEKKEEDEKTVEIDTKAFQRKRRIGVALINTPKKKENDGDNAEDVRRGFGFKNDSAAATSSVYPGFQKGGVMFVKTDVLNPPLPPSSTNDVAEPEEDPADRAKVEEMYSTLVEKLGFLNSGHPLMPPTQTMVIQAETLYVAMKDGGLKSSYLGKWLNDTCSELIKLEKEATPEGWLLLWDRNEDDARSVRSHKRYYYQNRTTGVSQWEYPQPDIQNCDDAMDISTTPPPEHVITMSPPLPPTIRSPTPPPPPIISAVDEHVNTKPAKPPQPVPPPIPTVQPLPPGVELSEITSNQAEEQVKKQDPLHSALDSFYSDIAAIENTNSNDGFPALPTEDNKPPETPVLETNHEIPKKKSKKVKLAPGLSLKKKGVSQLVEKWKNVQQHFND